MAGDFHRNLGVHRVEMPPSPGLGKDQTSDRHGNSEVYTVLKDLQFMKRGYGGTYQPHQLLKTLTTSLPDPRLSIGFEDPSRRRGCWNSPSQAPGD